MYQPLEAPACRLLAPDDLLLSGIWSTKIGMAARFGVGANLHSGRKENHGLSPSPTIPPLLNTNGSVREWVGTCTDVEETIHSAEVLKEANRRKDEFLAMLSHELRNPLAPIRNAVQILKTISPAELRLEWCRDVIDQQVRHMARLLEDLLDINRIARKSLELRKQNIDLRKIIRDSVAVSSPLIAAEQHKLIVMPLAKNLPVFGDAARLTQVFVNLLNNAAKYTENGGRIWLGAEVAPTSRPSLIGGDGDLGGAEAGTVGKEVIVSIRDTGIGIPVHLLPRIFDMFVQADGDTQHSKGGLGVGLALPREIVHLHGGSIHVESDGPGKGSEFTVRLPLAETAVDVQIERASAPAVPTIKTKRRILIVDDLHVQATSMAMLLELMGFEVRTAHDGTAALATAAEFLPEVALIDIGLPDIDGYEVARRMRELPRLQNIILVAQTGWGREEDREESRYAGFDYHLTKPIDHQILEKILLETTVPESRVADGGTKEVYKDHLIKVSAMYEPASRSWTIAVTISWHKQKNFHFHKLNETRTFDTEDDARAEGLILARRWIDHQL
jgi:signal transduction histidine kinase/CheY-like chemotaxis protein